MLSDIETWLNISSLAIEHAQCYLCLTKYLLVFSFSHGIIVGHDLESHYFHFLGVVPRGLALCRRLELSVTWCQYSIIAWLQPTYHEVIKKLDPLHTIVCKYRRDIKTPNPKLTFRRAWIAHPLYTVFSQTLKRCQCVYMMLFCPQACA